MALKSRMFLFTFCAMLCYSVLVQIGEARAQNTRWNRLNPAGTVPAEREGAAGLYDGLQERMLLIGGQNGTGSLRDVHALNLTRGEESWEQVPIGGIAPPARSFPAVALDSQNRRVILFGGESGSTFYQDTWAFNLDGSERTWTVLPTTNTPAGRSRCVGFYYPEGHQFIVFAGRTSFLGQTNETWSLDLDTLAWTALTFFGPVPRSRQITSAAVGTRGDALYIFGGQYTDFSGDHFLNDVWILTPGHQPEWALRPCGGSGPSARTGHVLALDAPGGQLYIFGGWTGSGGTSNYWNDTWTLGLDLCAWQALDFSGDPPDERRYAASVLDETNKRIIVFGGGGDSHRYFNDTYALPLPYYCKRNGLIVTGPGPGVDNEPLVKGFITGDSRLEAGTQVLGFNAYEGFRHKYGVHVAAGDILTGTEGMPEIVTGRGGGAHCTALVRVFTIQGEEMQEQITDRAPKKYQAGHVRLDFFGYHATRGYGVRVACGNVDGAPGDEIVTAPGPGPALRPLIRLWRLDPSDGDIKPLESFYAYNFARYGANVACGDLDGDGRDEILTGQGPGPTYGSLVRGWAYDGAADRIDRLDSVYFPAYGDRGWHHGVHVAAGDVDGDGLDDIVTGPGPAPEAEALVRCWKYIPWLGIYFKLGEFTAYDDTSHGVNVAAGDLNSDLQAEIVTGPGPGDQNASYVKAWKWNGNTFYSFVDEYSFMAYEDEDYQQGVHVCVIDDAWIVHRSRDRSSPTRGKTR